MSLLAFDLCMLFRRTQKCESIHYQEAPQKQKAGFLGGIFIHRFSCSAVTTTGYGASSSLSGNRNKYLISSSHTPLGLCLDRLGGGHVVPAFASIPRREGCSRICGSSGPG